GECGKGRGGLGISARRLLESPLARSVDWRVGLHRFHTESVPRRCHSHQISRGRDRSPNGHLAAHRQSENPNHRGFLTWTPLGVQGLTFNVRETAYLFEL